MESEEIYENPVGLIGTCNYKRYKDNMTGEPFGLKLFYFLCFCSAVAVYATLGVFWTVLSENAVHISDDYEAGGYSIVGFKTKKASAYDTCQIPEYKRDPGVGLNEYNELKQKISAKCRSYLGDIDSCKYGTRWSIIYALNAAINFLSAMNLFVMAIGAFVFYARYYATMCNCCLGCVNLFAWVSAIIGRWGPMGQWCTYNLAPS